MLKRSVVIVLTVLYVVTVSGFALNLHYCFNRLASVKIDAPANTCVKGLKNGMMKCCKDKHIEVKVKDAHQNGSPSCWAKFLPSFTFADLTFSLQSGTLLTFPDRGPPPSVNIPVYLRNCTFRI